MVPWLSTHNLVGQVARDICRIADEAFADGVEDLLLLPAENFEHKLGLQGLRKVKFDLAMKALRDLRPKTGSASDPHRVAPVTHEESASSSNLRQDGPTGGKKRCRWGRDRRRKMKKVMNSSSGKEQKG